MKHQLSVLAASLLAPFLAHAQCERHFETWAAELYSREKVDWTTATCKVWPMNPALTIAALPLSHVENTNDIGAYDLDVLITDSLTGTVFAKTHQPSAITYDAVRLKGIAIDTARYQLTPNQRAFGVRISYAGSSGIFPFDTTSLNLYVVENQVVRPVLNQFIVESRSGDWDGVCTGSFNSTSRSIEIGAPGVEGYVSLKVTEKNTRSVNVVSKIECVTKELQQTRSNITITYSNGHYPTPKHMKLDF